MQLLNVYILKCADNSYYTGVTNNIEMRLQQHNQGISKDAYTYTRRPVKLVWISDQMDPVQAISLEKKIQKWTRKKKEALINEQWDLLHELAKCKNGSSYEKYKRN